MKLSFNEFVRNRIDNIGSLDELMMADTSSAGPWLIPLSNGIVFGWALGHALEEDMGAELSFVAGTAAMIALVSTGILSTHNAARQDGGRWWWLVIGYITIELTALWLMEVPQNVKVVGTAAALMSLLAYIARAGAWASKERASIAQERETSIAQERAEKIEHERDIERLRLELEHQEKMARISAAAATATDTKADTVSAQEREEIARQILESNPDIAGSELGRRVGITEAGGRKLKNRLIHSTNGKS